MQKPLSRVLFAGALVSLVACISVEIKKPPVVTPPAPPVTVEPTPAPAPPTPVPPAPPVATPGPVPIPVPTVVPPTPKPPKPTTCKSIEGVCNTCDDMIEQAVLQHNWNCPRTQGWPGRFIDMPREDGVPVPREPYDASIGRGMCYNRGQEKSRVDRGCNRYAGDSDTLLNKAGDGRLGVICPCDTSVFPPTTPTPAPPRPSPTPPPPPVPVPVPTPDPAPGERFNFPLPRSVDSCTPEYTSIPVRVGIVTLGEGRPCSGDCRKDGYLGRIINVSATPHDVPPRCGHRPEQNKCEQWPGCQYGHDDLSNSSKGPVIVMKNAAWGDRWELVDKRSDNTYNAHHKPKQGETGLTTFKACYPGWDLDNDPRCGTITINVHGDGTFTQVSRTTAEQRQVIRKRSARGKPKTPTKWEPEEE